MNSIVERLIEADKNSVQATNGSRIFGEAVALIQQQAERIKELEAELESRKSTNAGWNAYYALRQRIADAPKKDHCSFHGYRVQGCKACSNMPISKEDLK